MWHEWERGEVHIGFWWENLKERDHLKDLGVDERIIIKCIFNKRDEGTWIDLDRDRDWWRALVSAAMDLRLPYSTANCLTR